MKIDASRRRDAGVASTERLRAVALIACGDLIGPATAKVRPPLHADRAKSVENARFVSAPAGGGVTVAFVRAIRFLPLVFLIGIDGFAMFAPYVIALFAIGYTFRILRREPARATISA